MARTGIKRSIVGTWSGYFGAKRALIEDGDGYGSGESSRDMNFVDYYNRVINWPGRTAVLVGLAIGVAFLLAAAIVLSADKYRKTGRFLGVVGVVVVMAFLWTTREQTRTARRNARITVTTYRYTPQSRLAVLISLVAVPAVASVVMSSVLFSTRRRLRRGSRAGSGRAAGIKPRNTIRQPCANLTRRSRARRNCPSPMFAGAPSFRLWARKRAALADFDRAIERDPQFAPAYKQRGKLRLESGEYDSALADFSMLMTLRASDADSYLSRGICLFKKGLFRDATADFHRVLKLTNHSDFADPAKQYLRECEAGSAGLLPAAGTNGKTGIASASEPISPEHTI